MSRKDAKRIKIDSLMQCAIDLKPKRCNNEVYINQDLDVTELVKYMNEKKKEGKNYTFFYAFLTAIGKTIYNRKKMNYFISNRHLYELNDVTLAYIAKVTLNDSSSEVMMTLKVEPEDTIESISNKTRDVVEKLRTKKESVHNAGTSAIDFLPKLPNFIRVPIFGLVKIFDRHGIIPQSLTANNIYYSSCIVSNLGSIGCGAIYHNVADFGTASSVVTIGEIKDKVVINKEGKQEIRKLCEFGITLDERIGDGFYFAKTCKMIEHILMHPEMLEERADTKIEM